MIKLFKSCLALSLGLTFFSCSNDDPAKVRLVTLTYKNLNADYALLVFGSDPALPPIRPSEKKKYTFFSFKTGQIVTVPEPNKSALWDIGFQDTNIIINGGTGRAGIGGAIVQEGAFDEIKEAPTTGYAQDNERLNQFAVSGAEFIQGVTTTTNNWWFNSGSGTSKIVSPLPRRVILIRTADGRYAKMEILSFHKGAPNVVNTFVDLDRHYTFKYIYQPGSTNSF
ncbi:MAG: HmuY family protein [Cyclobacteriaceae bacterium]|nr:HmuY family protein [Cyclobacteriaceae bacterium]